MDTYGAEAARVHAVPGVPAFDMVLPLRAGDYPGGNVQDEIKRHGVWAPAESRLLVRVLARAPPGSLLVDVGANTGYFSLLALALGHRALAVEPNPDHAPYLAALLARNGWQARCRWVEAFVSDRPGTAAFDGWSGYDGICRGELARPVPAAAQRDLATSAALLKVDVEGAEPGVFASLRPHLAAGAFPFVMFEVTYMTRHRLDAAQVRMLEELQADGFDLYVIHGEGLLARVRDVHAQAARWWEDYAGGPHAATVHATGCNMLAVHRTAPTDGVFAARRGDDLLV
ncbi:MAG: S-adenosyl-L-methionine-dependent methyltransferase [Monoraphidium minutum]|nr:MAG: S-adenosyl-L-methionine-dependent methyltransferase [Monoraphidium minutum]